MQNGVTAGGILGRSPSQFRGSFLSQKPSKSRTLEKSALKEASRLSEAPFKFWSVLFPDDANLDIDERLQSRLLNWLLPRSLPDAATVNGLRAFFEKQRLTRQGSSLWLETPVGAVLAAGLFQQAYGGQDADWEARHPLVTLVQGNIAEASPVREAQRLFQFAVGRVNGEIVEALQAALVTGRLDACGLLAIDPFGETKKIPAARFMPSIQFLIPADEILMGERVIGVTIARPPGQDPSDAELMHSFKSEIERISGPITQRRAFEIARELRAIQSRDRIRELLKQAGGATTPGPRGPRK